MSSRKVGVNSWVNRKCSKPDYAFKSKVLQEHSDLLKQVNKARLQDYKDMRFYMENCAEGVVFPTHKELDDIYVDCCLCGLKSEYDESIKILHAYIERVSRLKKRVASIITTSRSLFLTLTFNDNTLNETTEKERRILVSRYLKKHNAKYVGNIDFGSKNHREHYHAVIGCETVNCDLWHKYGAIKVEKVRLKDFESDNTKISKYIAKLTNHAIKETTRRSALIYSR